MEHSDRHFKETHERLTKEIQRNSVFLREHSKCKRHYIMLMILNKDIESFYRYFNRNVVSRIRRNSFDHDNLKFTRHVAMVGGYHYTKNFHFDDFIRNLELDTMNNNEKKEFIKRRRVYLRNKILADQCIIYLKDNKIQCSKWLAKAYHEAAEHQSRIIHDYINALNQIIQQTHSKRKF